MSSSRPFSLNKSLFNPVLYSRIRTLWFGDFPPPHSITAPREQDFKRWFGRGATNEQKLAFDNECRNLSLPALESLSPSEYKLPTFTTVDADRTNYPSIAAPFIPEFSAPGQHNDNALNALSIILLLDQLTRNIFRKDQFLIYAHYDRISRAILSEVLARKLDQNATLLGKPVFRNWLLMPWIHSESLNDHERAEKLLKGEIKEMELSRDQPAVDYLNRQLGAEITHADIIRKFGRYPHRNRALGRKTTEEEQKWLDEGGDTFGT